MMARLVYTIRKTLWYWLVIGEPTRWQTHFRKWREFDRAIREWE